MEKAADLLVQFGVSTHTPCALEETSRCVHWPVLHKYHLVRPLFGASTYWSSAQTGPKRARSYFQLQFLEPGGHTLVTPVTIARAWLTAVVLRSSGASIAFTEDIERDSPKEGGLRRNSRQSNALTNTSSHYIRCERTTAIATFTHHPGARTPSATISASVKSRQGSKHKAERAGRGQGSV